MDFFKNFNTQNDERDKIFRIIQYSAHLLWALQEKISNNKDSIRQLKKLEDFMSLSRQMLRLGKGIPVMNSTLDSMHLEDSILRTTISLSRISDALYLFCDNLLLLSNVGLFNINEKRFSELANNYWLYSTILLFLKNIYQMQLLFKNRPVSMEYPFMQGHSEWTNLTPSYLFNFACYNKNSTLEILKNMCDICLCLDALKKAKISSFKIGFFGVFSSLIPILKHKSFIF